MAALVSCAGSLQDKVCTLVGCSSGASVEATLAVKYDDLRLAAMMLCRNDTCVGGVLAPPSEEPMPHAETVVTFTTHDPQSHVSFATLWKDGDTWRLRLRWDEMSWDVLKDGDEYRLFLATSQGAVLIQRTGRATYQDFQPNGPDCEPLCRGATVTLAPQP